LDLGLLAQFYEFIGELLFTYYDYFEPRGAYRFVNEAGKEKLKKEWPKVWEEFDLDNSE